MQGKRPSYSEEYKERFFSLIDQGMSINAACKQLGIHVNTGRLWAMKRAKRKADEYVARKHGAGFDKTELVEVTHLAKEQQEYINYLHRLLLKQFTGKQAPAANEVIERLMDEVGWIEEENKKDDKDK